MAIPAYLMDRDQKKRLTKLEDWVKIIELEIKKLYKILERNRIR